LEAKAIYNAHNTNEAQYFLVYCSDVSNTKNKKEKRKKRCKPDTETATRMNKIYKILILKKKGRRRRKGGGGRERKKE
jgi:hypothetical protein